MAVFDSPQVSVGAKLQEKTLTSNDTYTPDLGYNGFSEVTVNVPSPQVTELPIASVEEEGKIYQYVGATQAYITNSVVTASDLSPDNPTVTIDASKLSGLPIRDSGGLMLSIEIDEESEKYISFVSDNASPEEYTFSSEPCNTIEEAYSYFGITFSPSAPQYAEVTYNSQTYTNGYFYKCIESSGSYSWVQTDVQPSPVIPDPLPSQTGQSGKFLTTDGTDTSWGTINALQNTATHETSLVINAYSNPTTTADNTVCIKGSVNNGVRGAVAVGTSAEVRSNYGVSIGHSAINYANVSGGIAIGFSTENYKSQGISIGYQARTNALYSIQIGSLSNNNVAYNPDDCTFKVANGNGNYEMLSADGTIPEARLADTTNASVGQVLTLDSNLNAVWAVGGSSSGISDVTVNGTSVVSGSVATITCATIDDTSTSSQTATWSASKLNTTIGDIESLINAL